MPSDSATRLGLVGARGRMGLQVRSYIKEFKGIVLSAALLRKGAAQLDDAGDILQTNDLDAFVLACDVILDFSAPSIAKELACACRRHNVPLVVASTGFDQDTERAIEEASKEICVLVASNVSLGVAALEVLLEKAGELLPSWDAELIETHHRHKRDAPSGTAKALGQALMRGQGLLTEEMRGALRPAPRPHRELGYSVVRGGDVPGEHQVMLFGDNERIELVHRAQSPRLFARGALVACKFVVGAGLEPGRYAMRDALMNAPCP